MARNSGKITIFGAIIRMHALTGAGMLKVPEEKQGSRGSECRELDLALFHNGKKLDIEVDGAMYHQTWTGELCYNDQLRNQALMRQGWDVMRFWVQQVRDQLPWCVDQVKKWMGQN